MNRFTLHISSKPFLTMLFLLIAFNCAAQTLTGTSGLFKIPTADMQKDGSITVGFASSDKKHEAYTNYQYNVLSGYVSFNYFPFLEVCGRLNRRLDDIEKTASEYVFDRVPIMRIRILKEKDLRPAVVIGAHDFTTAMGGTGAIHYNSLYCVATKHFKIFNQQDVGLHLGYGSDVIEAADHEFIGIFGGISYNPYKYLSLSLEYDAKHVNSGIKLTAFKHLTLIVGTVGFDSFSFGINYQIHLPDTIEN